MGKKASSRRPAAARELVSHKERVVAFRVTAEELERIRVETGEGQSRTEWIKSRLFGRGSRVDPRLSAAAALSDVGRALLALSGKTYAPAQALAPLLADVEKLIDRLGRQLR